MPMGLIVIFQAQLFLPSLLSCSVAYVLPQPLTLSFLPVQFFHTQTPRLSLPNPGLDFLKRKVSLNYVLLQTLLLKVGS